MKQHILVRSLPFNRRLFGAFSGAVAVCAFANLTAAQDDGANVKVPKYKPMNRGAPGGRIGGATRGAPPESLKMLALAPDHVAYTSQATPVLYWYLSDPVTNAVFTLQPVDAPNAAVKKDLSGTSARGVLAISLSELGLSLEPEKVYEWSVSLGTDQAKDVSVLSRGLIALRERPSKLTRQLQKAKPSETAEIYAANGYWYDAIDDISKLIAANPGTTSYSQMRAGLAEQVKLFDLADYDRGAM